MSAPSVESSRENVFVCRNRPLALGARAGCVRVSSVSTKSPPSVNSQRAGLPDVGGHELPDFDDGPTQIGSSWFPVAPPPKLLRTPLAARSSGPSRSAAARRDESSGSSVSGRRSSARVPPPLRASQGSPPFRSPSNQEEVSSFPAASQTLPPHLVQQPGGEMRHSALSAAKGVLFGLAITGLLGVGAVAYKATLGGSSAPAAAASGASSAWTLTGEVEPSRQASIQARGAGKVDELDVTVGAVVHEGDVLAKITGAAASTVRAPFDGVITAVYTAKGAEIAAGSSLPVADLADTSHVRVRLPLASGDEAKVRAGDAVTVWSEAAPTRTLRATVSRVIPSLNTRAASAEVELDHPGLTPLDRVHAQLR